MEEYLERKLKMTVRRARKVWARGNEYGMVVELGNGEEKREVMVRKRDLDRECM